MVSNLFYEVFGTLPLQPLAQGHLVPMVDIARILAQRGATVPQFPHPMMPTGLDPLSPEPLKPSSKFNY
ncbi:putative trans-zeatin O-beta-D-glucosyltransferase [Helianthus annuus]|nr:putative trans-zeatin O-beta-D-glucosyltransferase [Helianthus annuus]